MTPRSSLPHLLPANRGGSLPPSPQRGFTLVELLVVIAVIMTLIAMLIPVLRMIRNQSNKNYALNMVSDLGSAFEEYRAEDPRRLYPTPQNPGAPGFLDANPAHPAGALNLLQYHSTFNYSTKDIDEVASDASYLCLIDKWTRPIYYQLDGGYMTGAAPGPITLDTHLMNGVADRPVAAIGTVAAGIAPTWNATGVEPFAYIWSTGIPTGNGDTTDAQPANWPQWIYRATSQ